MTEQEIFDKVWNHFVVNKAPQSRSSKKLCRYRGPNGEMCAVGLLIPDEIYSKKMEGLRVGELINIGMLDGDFIKHKILLDRLQTIHDEPDMFALIEGFLRVVAEDYKLVVPGER